ncbi:MAG: hypothetical protein PHO25_11195 [Syntrophomonadaceae bacterium]|nr:hypothetical protein [Syntrophomonadaceae bacterium]
MRNHLKIIMLLLVSLTMVTVCAGCASPVSDIQQDSKSDTSELDNKKTAQTGTQPQYFFINGSLLGSYDDDGWHSLCDTGKYETGAGDSTTFYAKDLLNQDSYYVYENNKLAGVSKQIIWLTEEAFGLGSFEAQGAPPKFAKYGELYRFEGESGDTAYRYRIFDLPIKLDDELSKLKIPDYSFYTEFPFGEKWTRDCPDDRLVTNSGSNLFTKTMTYGVGPTAEGRQLLTDLLKKNNIENTIPNFTECVLGDFDNDGKKEYLMFAESPRSEMGYPLLYSNGKTDNLGVFNFIFYQDDDGSIQTLYSDLRPLKGVFKPNKNNNMELMQADYCIWIDLFLAADLNADGVYEIGVKKTEWDRGHYLTYAMNSGGEYEVVMRSNFGT